MSEIKIGQMIWREGKSPLCICGFTHDGKFLAYHEWTRLKLTSLLKYFKQAQLVVGSVLSLPNGRVVELIEPASSSWRVKNFGEVMTLTTKDIEELEAAHNARQIYHEVATRTEIGSSRNIRFLPKKTGE